MDINQFYSIVQFIANKNQQGYLSPDEFNNAVNLAQSQLMEELVNQLQGWDGNKRRIRIQMGNAQRVIQKLAPFIVKENGVLVDAGGLVNKPDDIVHMLAIRADDDMKRVKRVESDRIYSNRSSRIDAIDTSPIYTEYNGYYQVSPNDITQINWEYVRSAPEVRWAFTLVNGRPVYDQVNSLDPLWKETEVTELISRVLFMFGISVQAQNLVGYYQNIKNDGQ